MKKFLGGLIFLCGFSFAKAGEVKKVTSYPQNTKVTHFPENRKPTGYPKNQPKTNYPQGRSRDVLNFHFESDSKIEDAKNVKQLPNNNKFNTSDKQKAQSRPVE